MKRLSLLLIPLLVSCASTEPVPDNSFYRFIDSPKATPLTGEPIQATLYVDRVSASGILRERALLYTAEGSQEMLKQHHYHHWVDTPTTLIRERAVRYLEQSNLFHRVATDSRSRDYILQIELKHLERELLTKKGTKVRLAFKAELFDADSGDILLTKEYDQSSLLQNEAVSASVKAMDALMTDTLAQLVSALSDVVRK